jgi:uncharacterized protein YkwD
MRKIRKHLISVITIYLLSIYPVFSQVIDKESLVGMEYKVLELVNAHRKAIGLGGLQFNDAIYAEALKHSKDMADGVVPFSHEGFDGRADRLMSKVGGNAVAENVASGQPDAESVLESWLESAVHKQNIEGNYNLTGIGIARSKDGELYFTQIFLLKKSFKK